MATWSSIDLSLRKPVFNVEAINDNRLHSDQNGVLRYLERERREIDNSLLHHSACSASG